MSRVLTNEQNYYDIADTIRQMKNVNTTYKPREMASALKDIYSNEVEGTLPLSFEANGNNLLDYRIDGASGGVGDRTGNLFDEIYPGINGSVRYRAIYVGTGFFTLSSDIPIFYNTANLFLLSGNVSSGASSSVNGVVYGVPRSAESIDGYITIGYRNYSDVDPRDYNTMLNEGSTALPYEYEPYGYKVPVVMNGKNLLNNVASTVTFQGVKFTINEDKSITLDGTASNSAWFTVQSNNVLGVGQYILTGAVNNTVLRYQKNSTGYAYDDTGAGRNINITQKTTSGLISLKITENVFYDNITIYPMIRLAAVEDDTYEPYIEPTTTNIYLDEPIEENESISLSDTNTNIPTIDGTNVITIATTVQPSNVYVQAPKDSEEIVYLTTILEEEI